ncbi:NAD(P)-binding protein [Exidia glandulosa HHB12029]|uniref:NAD(P)-binding protein n=1 Tax=Exidia glandulosa HHB12029 TaxID=1314781 RepID=A0A165EHJ1_EXIGL|nr:NAD(P)-binding protein [Exidia glandulosa HHB12029]
MFAALGIFWTQAFPPKPQWTVDDIPDLSGKVTIVTGGNSGVGYETCKALLSHNAKVYMASRSKSKAEEAIAQLHRETGKSAIFLELDLGSLASVKQAAQTFLGLEPELHILFNNGGIMTPPIEALTADGYDLQHGTNVLGHYFFTTLLVPALAAGARTSHDGKARIVVTASSVADFCRSFDFSVMKGSNDAARRKMGTQGLYIQSKFANIMLSKEFARRLVDRGIVTNAVNPGNLQSNLQRHQSAFLRWIMNTTLLHPVRLGALTQLYVGTAPETAQANGKYFIPWARPGDAVQNPLANDAQLSEKLWDWLEEQVQPFL